MFLGNYSLHSMSIRIGQFQISFTVLLRGVDLSQFCVSSHKPWHSCLWKIHKVLCWTRMFQREAFQLSWISGRLTGRTKWRFAGKGIFSYNFHTRKCPTVYPLLPQLDNATTWVKAVMEGRRMTHRKKKFHIILPGTCTRLPDLTSFLFFYLWNFTFK